MQGGAAKSGNLLKPLDNAGAVSYKVYRSTSETGEYKLMKTTTSLSYVNTGAAKNTTYYYKVKAVCGNTDGNSAYSKVVSIKSK